MGAISFAVPFGDRWYFTELLRGAWDRVEAVGHTLLVHVIPSSAAATGAAAAAIEQDFAAGGTIGAIAAGFRYRSEQGSRAKTWERPLVIIGGSQLGFPTVMIDDIGAARTAVQHLIGLGHRRIVHFTGLPQDQADFLANSRRVKGYRQAMESADLQPVLVENPFDADAVRRAALELLQRPDRPTAVFAVSDEIAFPVLRAARELGLEPGRDLSVVGIDDHPESKAADLTTVRQNPAEIGAAAVDLLLSGITPGLNPGQSRLLPITLVARGSTGRPRTS